MDGTLEALTQQVDATSASILNTLHRLQNPSTITAANEANIDNDADEIDEQIGDKFTEAAQPQFTPGVRIQQMVQLTGGDYKLSIKAPNTVAPLITKTLARVRARHSGVSADLVVAATAALTTANKTSEPWRDDVEFCLWAAHEWQLQKAMRTFSADLDRRYSKHASAHHRQHSSTTDAGDDGEAERVAEWRRRMEQRKALWQHPASGSVKVGQDATKPRRAGSKGVVPFGASGGPAAHAAALQQHALERTKRAHSSKNTKVVLPSGHSLSRHKGLDARDTAEKVDNAENFQESDRGQWLGEASNTLGPPIAFLSPDLTKMSSITRAPAPVPFSLQGACVLSASVSAAVAFKSPATVANKTSAETSSANDTLGNFGGDISVDSSIKSAPLLPACDLEECRVRLDLRPLDRPHDPSGRRWATQPSHRSPPSALAPWARKVPGASSLAEWNESCDFKGLAGGAALSSLGLGVTLRWPLMVGGVRMEVSLRESFGDLLKRCTPTLSSTTNTGAIGVKLRHRSAQNQRNNDDGERFSLSDSVAATLVFGRYVTEIKGDPNVASDKEHNEGASPVLNATRAAHPKAATWLLPFDSIIAQQSKCQETTKLEAVLVAVGEVVYNVVLHLSLALTGGGKLPTRTAVSRSNTRACNAQAKAKEASHNSDVKTTRRAHRSTHDPCKECDGKCWWQCGCRCHHETTTAKAAVSQEGNAEREQLRLAFTAELNERVKLRLEIDEDYEDEVEEGDKENASDRVPKKFKTWAPTWAQPLARHATGEVDTKEVFSEERQLEIGSRVQALLGGGEAWLMGTLVATVGLEEIKEKGANDAAAGGASIRPSYTVAFDVGVQEVLPLDAVRPIPVNDARRPHWAVGDQVEVRDQGRKWASGVISKVHVNGTTDVSLQSSKNDDDSRGARKLFSVPPESLRKAGPTAKEEKQSFAEATTSGSAGGSNLSGEALRMHELKEDRAARAAIAKILAKNGLSRSCQVMVRYGDNGGAFLRGGDDNQAGSGKLRTVVVVGNLGAGVESRSTQTEVEQLLARHVTFKEQGATLDASSGYEEEEDSVVLPHYFAVSVEVRSSDAAVAPRVRGGLFLGNSGRRADNPPTSTQPTPPLHDPLLPAYMWDLDRGASKRNASSNNADTTQTEAGPAAAAPTAGAESKGISAFKSKVPRFASDPTKEAALDPPTTLNDKAWLLTRPSSGPAPSIAPRPQHRPRRVLSRYAGKKHSPAEERNTFVSAPSWNAGPKLGPRPSDKPSDDIPSEDGPSAALVVAQRRALEQAAEARRGPGAYDTDAAYARTVRRRVTAATLTGRPPPLTQGMPLQDTAPPVEKPENSHDAEAAMPPLLELPDNAAAEPKAMDQAKSSKGCKGASESDEDEEAKPHRPNIRPDDYSPSDLHPSDLAALLQHSSSSSNGSSSSSYNSSTSSHSSYSDNSASSMDSSVRSRRRRRQRYREEREEKRRIRRLRERLRQDNALAETEEATRRDEAIQKRKEKMIAKKAAAPKAVFTLPVDSHMVQRRVPSALFGGTSNRNSNNHDGSEVRAAVGWHNRRVLARVAQERRVNEPIGGIQGPGYYDVATARAAVEAPARSGPAWQPPPKDTQRSGARGDHSSDNEVDNEAARQRPTIMLRAASEAARSSGAVYGPQLHVSWVNSPEGRSHSRRTRRKAARAARAAAKKAAERESAAARGSNESEAEAAEKWALAALRGSNAENSSDGSSSPLTSPSRAAAVDGYRRSFNARSMSRRSVQWAEPSKADEQRVQPAEGGNDYLASQLHVAWVDSSTTGGGGGGGGAVHQALGPSRVASVHDMATAVGRTSISVPAKDARKEVDFAAPLGPPLESLGPGHHADGAEKALRYLASEKGHLMTESQNVWDRVTSRADQVGPYGERPAGDPLDDMGNGFIKPQDGDVLILSPKKPFRQAPTFSFGVAVDDRPGQYAEELPREGDVLDLDPYAMNRARTPVGHRYLRLDKQLSPRASSQSGADGKSGAYSEAVLRHHILQDILHECTNSRDEESRDGPESWSPPSKGATHPSTNRIQREVAVEGDVLDLIPQRPESTTDNLKGGGAFATAVRWADEEADSNSAADGDRLILDTAAALTATSKHPVGGVDYARMGGRESIGEEDKLLELHPLSWSPNEEEEDDFVTATRAALRSKAQQKKDLNEARARAQEEESLAEQRREAALNGMMKLNLGGGAAVNMALGPVRFTATQEEDEKERDGDALSLSPQWKVGKAREGRGAVGMSVGAERFGDALDGVADLRGPEGGAMVDVDAALQEAWNAEEGDGVAAREKEPTIAELTGQSGNAAVKHVKAAVHTWARDGDRLDLAGSAAGAERKKREAAAQAADGVAEWSRAPERWVTQAEPDPEAGNEEGGDQALVPDALAKSGVNYDTMLGRPEVEADRLAKAEKLVRAQDGNEEAYLKGIISPKRCSGNQPETIRMSEQWRRSAGLQPGSPLSKSSSSSDLVLDLLGPVPELEGQELRLSPHRETVEPKQRSATLRPKAKASSSENYLRPAAASSLSVTPPVVSPGEKEKVEAPHAHGPISHSPSTASEGPSSKASSTSHALAVQKALCARRTSKMGADSAEGFGAPGFMGSVAEALLASKRAPRPTSARPSRENPGAGASAEEKIKDRPASTPDSTQSDVDWYTSWAN